MKLSVRLFLLVLVLLSACSAPAGKAASNPTATAASTATVVPPTAAFTNTPLPATATATLTPSVPLAPSASPAAAASPTTAASATNSPTPFPAASPTAQRLPTQVVKEPPKPTPGGPPTPTPAPAPSLLDQYLPKRVKVAETAHFIFYAQDGYFPVDPKWWTSQAEAAYTYVSQRLDNIQVKHKISVAFHKPDTRPCPIRGFAAESGSPQIIIFAGPDDSQAYLLGVLSHEVGHAISYDGFPEGLPGNIALAEGIASWGSGKYWAAWLNSPSIDDMVRGYLKDGAYEPIHENTDLHGIYPWQSNTGSGQNCLARRDKVYSEWASFIGYLIDTYGWPKAQRLFRLPNPIHQPGETIQFPPDYQGIYGKALNQLEWEWLNWLEKK